MSTNDQREAARYRQEVLQAYRAWVGYLEAQQVLHAPSSAAPAEVDLFEGPSGVSAEVAAARQRLATLAPDARLLFDAVLDAERQEIQQGLDAAAPVRGGTLKRADPDEVSRRALHQLLEAARGRTRDDGRGLLPRGTPGAVTWLALSLQEIAAAPPTQTDYELARRPGDGRRKVVLNIVFALLALAGIPVLIALLRGPQAEVSIARAPTANGAPLALWPITQIAEPTGEWSLPVEAVDTRWPPACQLQPAHGCWHSGSFRPIALCLPAARLAALSGVRLGTPGGLPSRIYAVDGAALGADLVLNPCERGVADAPPRYGHLRLVELSPDLAPGTDAPAGFTVARIGVLGRGEQPELPEGRAVVSVAVADPTPDRDWVALAPTLLLADGSTALPSDTRRDEVGIIFDYLVAEPAEPFDLLWQVTLADQVVRYRATLDPPLSRDAVLRAALRVEEIAVTPSRQTMVATLLLHNAAATPLVVSGADLAFQTSATRQAVAAPTLRQPLAPDERRIVTLELPLESGVLEVGPFRFELAVGR